MTLQSGAELDIVTDEHGRVTLAITLPYPACTHTVVTLEENERATLILALAETFGVAEEEPVLS